MNSSAAAQRMQKGSEREIKGIDFFRLCLSETALRHHRSAQARSDRMANSAKWANFLTKWWDIGEPNPSISGIRFTSVCTLPLAAPELAPLCIELLKINPSQRTVSRVGRNIRSMKRKVLNFFVIKISLKILKIY